MPATIMQDFDLPMNRVALSAIEAVRQLGYGFTATSPNDSSRTLTFETPDAANQSYFLVVKQTIPSSSRVIVSGKVPQVCQGVIDRIQAIQRKMDSGGAAPKTQGT